MNPILLRAMVALFPTGILLSGSLVLFARKRNTSSFLQLLGAGCLVLVALTHICDALHLLPGINWGREGRVGHYLNLASAVLGVTLFPLEYLLGNLRATKSSP